MICKNIFRKGFYILLIVVAVYIFSITQDANIKELLHLVVDQPPDDVAEEEKYKYVGVFYHYLCYSLLLYTFSTFCDCFYVFFLYLSVNVRRMFS